MIYTRCFAKSLRKFTLTGPAPQLMVCGFVPTQAACDAPQLPGDAKIDQQATLHPCGAPKQL